MQATQPIRVINTQYGTDDAHNPWCVVEEITHQDYIVNASVRRVCTVNSVLTRRSLDPTRSTLDPTRSTLDPTTPTAPASTVNIQETGENLVSPTDVCKDASFKKSQKKIVKSRSRRKKFFRVLLCCSSGAVDADDDMYDTKPMDPPHSISEPATTDNARDQDRTSENVRSSSGRTEYIPVETEWSVTPAYVEYNRQTASSSEYDATITQAVRRQSAISTAQDSSVIQVQMEQRHYECTLARVSEDRNRPRGGVVIRELSPTYPRISQSAIAENVPETTSRNRDDAPSRTNLASQEQSETRHKHRRRSAKRVSFGSIPTLSETAPGPLQSKTVDGYTSAGVASLRAETPLHPCQDEADTSEKNEHVNDVTDNLGNVANKSSTSAKRRENLVVKRRSDGSRYVARKTFNMGHHGLVNTDSAQGPSRSEPTELTEYILDTPRLSRKISSDERKEMTSTIRRPRVSFGSMPTLAGSSIIEDNITDTLHHPTNQSSYPVMSNRMTSSCSSDNMLDRYQQERDATVNTSEVNIARNTKNDVPLKSILKVRGASGMSANSDVTRSLNSVAQKPINGQEEKKWVVKRRSDGSRYVTKISNDNNNLSGRRSAEHVSVQSTIHAEEDCSQSDVRVMSHKDKKEPEQTREMWRSKNGRNDTVESSRDERNQSTSVTRASKQQNEFSTSDAAINGEKRHRLVVHRDVDLSNATLLAIL